MAEQGMAEQRASCSQCQVMRCPAQVESTRPHPHTSRNSFLEKAERLWFVKLASTRIVKVRQQVENWPLSLGAPLR
eukprot:1136952-Pelagomonas_calceolata.AAC.6